MTAANNGLLAGAATGPAVQYPAYRGCTGARESPGPAGHIVRQSYRNRDFLATGANDLVVKFKRWPTLIGRQVVHRPKAPSAEALLDLDALTRLDIEKRSCGECERGVGVDNKAQMVRCASRIEHKRGKRRMQLILPVRIVANVAPCRNMGRG